MRYLFLSEIPESATVIDCRTKHQYGAWHYPGSKHIGFESLLDSYNKLPKNDTYVLYCPIGYQSAVIVEKMQRSGYEAYSFEGGTSALMEYEKTHSQKMAYAPQPQIV